MYENIKVLTFSKGNFSQSQNKLIEKLSLIGIDNIIKLSDTDLDESFKKEFEILLTQKRGYGYWIWKPYIILNELKKLKENEILLYMDSTDYPEKELFDFIIEHFKTNDYLLANRGYNNGEWTKMDCFILMGCNEKKYHETVQLEAGFVCLKKTDENIKMIEEWFDTCKNKNILTDIPNMCGINNLPNFKDHRHDQSILTNLSIKYKKTSVRFGDNFIKYNYNQPLIY